VICKHKKLGQTFGSEIVAFIDINMHEQTLFACVLQPALKLGDYNM
jgi:hypothetical protein